MRAMRTTSISFGLVNVPVKMYKAVDSHDVSFHQYHKDCMGSIGYFKACKECGENTDTDSIVRGIESGGSIVTVDEDELAGLEVRTGPEISVSQFINADEVDPIALEGHYYLAPQTAAAVEGYSLLRQVMQDTGRVAVVRFVMRRTGGVGKSHLGILRPYGNVLAIHTMSYADEIRQPAFPVLDKTVELKPALIEMAHTLVDAMTAPFNAAEYSDDYTDNLNELIAAKSNGETIVICTKETSSDVSDLLAQLEASTAARMEFAQNRKAIA